MLTVHSQTLVSSDGWQSPLPLVLARRAQEVATQVAQRATDSAVVELASVRAADQTAYPSSAHWTPLSMARGNTGLALLAGQLNACCPGQGWDVTAHEHLRTAVRYAEQVSAGASVFGGLAGLGLAAATAAHDSTRYRRLLLTIDEAVAAALAGLRIEDGGGGLPVSAFDVISGLSGVGAYLLRRTAQAACRTALHDVLNRLVALAEPADPPRWWTPAQLLGDPSLAARYPAGNLNCGLAHGIPGPLAMLSLATLSGVTVPGQDDAIRHLADWVVRQRVVDRWGVNWPNVVPVAAGSTDEPPSRSAWCYGSPGVARSIWLAGHALADPGLLDLAVEAMEAVFARPQELRGIDSPTFCHGIAGLLQITLRFAVETGLPSFTAAAAVQTEQLLSHFDPSRILGYGNIEPDGRLVDQPGLLDGAPGVALTLLAAGTRTPPAWDRLFLLS